MVVHKLTVFLFLLGLVSIDVDVANANGTELPALTDTQRSFLSKVARRTVRDAALGRTDYEPQYIPPKIKIVICEAVVRLRLDGYLLSQTSVGPGPVALVVRDAALACMRNIKTEDTIDVSLANKLLIEIELVGPAEQLPPITDWTSPQALKGHLESGIHGLALNGAGINIRFCPTEVITSDRPLSEALRALAQASLPKSDDMAKVRLARFRTDHWYQRASREPVIRLHRGLSVISPQDVSRESIQQAITALADYMVDRQLESGLFSYQYEPGQDIFSDGNSPIRQIGASTAMAMHARDGKDASLSASRRAIRFHLRGVTPLSGVDGASFVATADGRNSLGVTASLCLLLGESQDAAINADVRQQLVDAMIWLQRPSGMFLTAFPPARAVEGQDHYPGQALLAMAVHYSHHPSGHILDVFNKALKYYRTYFEESPNPVFVPWQLRAFATMATHTKRDDFADYVFALADWIVERQLTGENCDWPELFGGIAVQRKGFANFTTSIQLEALSDAYSLAQGRGDSDRMTRYASALRQAVRFVMQLQVRPEEAYYMRSPRDAVGGIRTDLAVNLLRIDHCQHALIALIKARDVLYSRED